MASARRVSKLTIPSPQSPVPSPQSPVPSPQFPYHSTNVAVVPSLDGGALGNSRQYPAP
ncbi:hypothetical protein [Sphaerospermopsis sp. FACHB-1094]|uniref:hypothetical protein n=1 Tax=Sphaerospermopsis sp. FACHB-1094 TaxID=2692861 RepID=UPI00168390EF|nr:hypothetical protein [Sphaerospermopsis sp. FACHB-1094]